MYEHHHANFGKNQRHVIENPTTKNGFSLSPTAGADLLGLKFAGENILDGYETADELEALHWKKNILLFPFPNRLDGGKYEIDGQPFFFLKNNADTQNAIHGFAFSEKFEISKIILAPNFAEVTCRLDDAGTNLAYPFATRFEVVFKISDTKNGGNFSVKFLVKNRSKKTIPVGIGWHPYFRLTENVGNTFLKMPPCQKVEIDSRMLPTGELSDFENYKIAEPIGDDFLDNCFKINDSEKKWAVEIAGGGKKLRFEANRAAWPFLQIFTPPHRKSVAIEPMTCNVDAFNNGDGLIKLGAGETWRGGFWLRYS